MKYRLMVVKTFDDPDEARDAFHDVEVFWEKGGKAPDDFANLHRCFHDEDPPRPCELVKKLVAASPQITP